MYTSSDPTISGNASSNSQQLHIFQHTRLSLAVITSLVLLYIALPTVIWAYNIDRAKRSMEHAIVWPKQREVDSLPELRDGSSLPYILAHLKKATYWKPENSQAFRLTSQVHAARGNWLEAAELLDQAYNLAPTDPLIIWERALVYEQLREIKEKAPRENILPDLGSAPINAPEQSISTVYCRDSRPETCYVGLDRFVQPYAHTPHGSPLPADVLFMHPPSSVTLTYYISSKRPVLQFLLGLDPNVRSWGTDGATYEIWVVPQKKQPTLVYRRTIDAITAKEGWTIDLADLSAWVDQTVVLEFRTTGGVNQNTVGDWYAWGDVRLTTQEAATAALQIPEAQLHIAWRKLGLSDLSETFIEYGDQKMERRQFQAAYRWYNRARFEEKSSRLAFLSSVAAIASNNSLAADISPDEFAIHDVESRVHIDAKTLRWLRQDSLMGLDYGDQLGKHTEPDVKVGIMGWPGSAITSIRVPMDGTYIIRFRAMHSSAPPVDLQLEHNLHPVSSFSLKKGDMSWQVFETEIFLKQGLHLIGVRFLNDGVVDGINRDAVLDWIKVNQK